ncbi:MAG: DEAD/DEAH box helicase [bacterium]
MRGKLLIDIEDDRYILTGDIKAVLEDKRFTIALKRLNFSLINLSIEIPFENNQKIKVLQDIQELLKKFDFNEELSESVVDEISVYNEENKNFSKFTEKARKIRNNEFSSNPDLVSDFLKFKETLQQNMKRNLYDLQMLSAYHMAFSQHSCNFAVPGAGKTSIVYGAYTFLKSLPKSDKRHVDKLLVIGPLSSFAPWENEYEECFGVPVKSQRLSGDSKILRDHKEQHLYSDNPSELTIISHAGISNLEKEIIDFLKKNKTMVVVDEAHRIKNTEGVWGQSIIEISKEAIARVALTGTPVPNGYEDLYNLFRFLYPFKYKDILQIHYEQLKELTKNNISTDDFRIETFINNIKPYFIRIKKSDLKLPGVEEKIVFIDMDENQRKIYDFIEEKYIKSFVKNPVATVKDVLNKARLIRLRQAATNPSLLLRTLKDSMDSSDYDDVQSNNFLSDDIDFDDSDILKNLIAYDKFSTPQKFLKIKEIYEKEVSPTNGKVIVWTIFIKNAEDLQVYLNKSNIKSRLLIGRIPQEEREDVIKKFNNPDNHDFNIVIANPFSVSESISLHKGCHNAIYMERDYNAANFLQSKDRIHRVGLKEDVITKYFYLVSHDSIDSCINEKLDLKIERMKKIIDEDIPLFSRINDLDETDIITMLLDKYRKGI